LWERVWARKLSRLVVDAYSMLRLLD
ncbi:hypothetical protein A2U01_0085134, partial [Trifolium medium]|nr:hypothetical protein [Trifolium medium]